MKDGHTKNAIGNLVERIADQLKMFLQLNHLKFTGRTAIIVSSLITMLIVGIFFCLALLFLATGAVFWLGDWFGSRLNVFLIGIGIFIIGGVLFFLMRKKWIKEPFRDSMIRKMYEQKNQNI
jgi:hypothetical protein